MNAKMTLLAVAASLSAVTLFGQTYSIDWHSLDAGGGTSTGGVFSVSGTIGQPDPGPAMSGGAYSLTGGFWSIFALQTPGEPQLTVRLTSTNTVLVSWPLSVTGYALQQNPDISRTNWTVPSELITNDGTNQFILVTPPVGNRSYRLRKP